jgi:hypothetical protein
VADFTTYAGLKTAIGDLVTRPDLVADGTVAGWIVLAEATLKRELRRAVTLQSFTFTSGTSSKALPGTVAEIRSIAPAVSVNRPRGGKPLIKKSWEDFLGLRANLVSGSIPIYYAVLDQTVYVAPAPDDNNLDFTISTFDALISVATDTTLLLEAPDVLLYGALAHSAPYLEHDERFSMWVQIFKDGIAGLNEKRQKEEFGQSLQSARMPINFGGGRVI